ncbi:scavenger receptor cysteine-rich domain-containing protein DMBT1-like [Paramisgurnus dabryanus]|uniref:scavenger receptor cysteine-rich domain-containing protein DMBT1-like n=1 Tax=Paramisgurnus dabryanus TaxID=90735 RepID=UPI003CCF8CAE
MDAGVICHQSVIRLVKGNNYCAGRVEVYHKGIWGTVCDDGWGISDAQVVCRELGYPVRLVDGIDSCSGRVEVYHNGQWGTVCDNGWDLSDAAVVCRELRCGPYPEPVGGAYFGLGLGPVWMSGVDCVGSESTLMKCNSVGWRSNSCGHEQDAGVICSGQTPQLDTVTDTPAQDQIQGKVVLRIKVKAGLKVNPNDAAVKKALLEEIWQMLETIESLSLRWKTQSDDNVKSATVKPTLGSIRLMDGINTCSGRVEIYTDDWGTVCDLDLDSIEGNMICTEAGCGPFQSVKAGAFYGQGTGPLLTDDLNCYGNESAVINCEWDNHTDACDHKHDVSVICEPIVRFVGGVNNCSGIVEIFHNKVWGTICGNSWDMLDAQMACMERGCGNPIATTPTVNYGQGTETRLVDGYDSCSGRVEVLYINAGWGTVCDNGWNLLGADLICKEMGCGSALNATKINVATGPNKCTGTLAVRYNEVWGSICQNSWDYLDGIVACRELGCGPAYQVIPGAAYGQGPGAISLDGLGCTGKVRLVDGDSVCSGRVEILFNNQWGTVCDDNWDMTDAGVVCRELGCGTAVEAKKGAYFGSGVGQIWRDELRCTGSEASVVNCPSNGWGVTDCGHNKDAGVICRGKPDA